MQERVLFMHVKHVLLSVWGSEAAAIRYVRACRFAPAMPWRVPIQSVRGSVAERP